MLIIVTPTEALIPAITPMDTKIKVVDVTDLIIEQTSRHKSVLIVNQRVTSLRIVPRRQVKVQKQ